MLQNLEKKTMRSCIHTIKKQMAIFGSKTLLELEEVQKNCP